MFSIDGAFHGAIMEQWQLLEVKRLIPRQSDTSQEPGMV